MNVNTTSARKVCNGLVLVAFMGSACNSARVAAGPGTTDESVATRAVDAVDALLDPTKTEMPNVDGTWVVDLRPTPDAPAYDVAMELKVRDGRVVGTFYDTEIENGFANDTWGDLVVGFTTRDGSGVYYSTATLHDDVLRGSTLSVGRQFLAVWTARRNED